MSQFGNSLSMRKVNRLNEDLEARFGLTLDVKSPQHLTEVRDHYSSRREFLIAKHGYADAFFMEEYAKAVIISEAINLILKEIVSKRLKPRIRRKGTK